MKILVTTLMTIIAYSANSFAAEPPYSVVFYVIGLDQQQIDNKIGQLTDHLQPFASEVSSKRILGFTPVVRFPKDPEFRLLSNNSGVERILMESESGKSLFKVPEIKVVFLAKDQSAIEKAYKTSLESELLHADLDLTKLWFTVNAYDCK